MKIRRILLISTLCLGVIAACLYFFYKAGTPGVSPLSDGSGTSAMALIVLLLLGLPVLVAFCGGLLAAAVYFLRKYKAPRR